MNSGPLISLGVLLTIASAWLGLMFAPYTQVSNVELATPVQSNIGLAVRGREVYIANGCFQCHSQKVRPGADIERGLGLRASVPQDYYYDKPPLLGVNRIGPDLANVGARRPDANWHYRHLFNPRSETAGSNMPSFRHLFDVRKLDKNQPSDNKIKTRDKDGHLVNWEIPEEFLPGPGYEIVIGDDAKALTAYLQSLNHSQPVASPPAPAE